MEKYSLSPNGDGKMTNKEHEFWEAVKDLSPTLADWVEAKFKAGFKLEEVKAYLIAVGQIAGRI